MGRLKVSHTYSLTRHTVTLASVSDGEGGEVMRPMPFIFEDVPAGALRTWLYRYSLGDVVL